MSSVLRLERKQKNLQMHFQCAYFYFLTINTFIHSRSSLKNHTRFQTKMGKVYTCFQTKKAPKTPPCGAAHTYMAYIRKYPPPPGLSIKPTDFKFREDTFKSVLSNTSRHNSRRYLLLSLLSFVMILNAFFVSCSKMPLVPT